MTLARAEPRHGAKKSARFILRAQTRLTEIALIPHNGRTRGKSFPGATEPGLQVMTFQRRLNERFSFTL
jgi:hypothetical protein